jgi:hypothetical protein
MPIAARWRPFDRLPPRRGRDAMPGVYELADENRQVIYIGQSGRDVPNRIRQHLERHGCIRSQAHYWRYAFSRIPQAEEAELLARHQDRHGTLPRCNRGGQRQRDPEGRYRERSRGE